MGPFTFLKISYTFNVLFAYAHDNHHNNDNKLHHNHDHHHHHQNRGLRGHPVDAEGKHFSSFETWANSKEFRKSKYARCSQKEPTTEESEMSNDVTRRWIGRHNCADDDDGRSNPLCRASDESRNLETINPIEIRTYVHVIRRDDGSGETSDDQIQNSINRLNEAFAPYVSFPFDFFADVTYTDDTRFYEAELESREETEMKTKLRRGDCNDLNIYFLSPKGGLLGWSRFPWDCRKEMAADGVVVLDTTTPGGSSHPFDEGNTLVHEVGHWLGLFHTFYDGCGHEGDEVMDTPAEESPGFGCPVGRDTCPGGGTDPVRNYMDYSNDACMDHFTKGQFTRMLSMFDEYRDLKDTAFPSETSVVTSFPSESPSKVTEAPTFATVPPSDFEEPPLATGPPSDFVADDAVTDSSSSSEDSAPPSDGVTYEVVTSFPSERPSEAALTVPPSDYLTYNVTNDVTDGFTDASTTDSTEFSSGVPSESPIVELDSNPPQPDDGMTESSGVLKYHPSATPSSPPTETVTASLGANSSPSSYHSTQPSEYVTSYSSYLTEEPLTRSPTESPTIEVTDAVSGSVTDSLSTFASEDINIETGVGPVSSPTQQPFWFTESPTTAATVNPSQSVTDSTSEPFSDDFFMNTKIPGPTPSPSILPTITSTSYSSSYLTKPLTGSPTESPTVEVTDAVSGSVTDTLSTFASEDINIETGVGPVSSPTQQPFWFTESPTTTATVNPSQSVTDSTSESLSASLMNTRVPTNTPSIMPTSKPSVTLSLGPSKSISPSATTSNMPSSSTLPTNIPSTSHSSRPSITSSLGPSNSINPSLTPSNTPSSSPTKESSSIPSKVPSNAPTISIDPSTSPTFIPSTFPSSMPSSSNIPSTYHSHIPSTSSPPTNTPSISPSSNPSVIPSLWPSTSRRPSTKPTYIPSSFPTKMPSSIPSAIHSNTPTISTNPSILPSINPTKLRILTYMPKDSSPIFESSSNSWVFLSFDDFEDSQESNHYTGWGNFEPGGSDARRYEVKSFAHGGEASLYIRDDSGDESSIVSKRFDVKPFDVLRVNFWFYPWEMDRNDGFLLEYSVDDSSEWVVAESWTYVEDFDNDVWYNRIEVISTVDVDFIRIRFRSESSSRRDVIFIDDVELSAL